MQSQLNNLLPRVINFFEKCYSIKNKDNIVEIFVKGSSEDIKQIKSFKSLKKLKFVEYPKKGFLELNKVVKKIYELSGGILLIDYGYLNSNNLNTIQAIMGNKKISMRTMFKNLGKADITSLVNFNLLKEYFIQNNLKVKDIVSQKFLEWG